jgi:hypothetical protein
MYIEYQRMHLGKEPITFITEEFCDSYRNSGYLSTRLQYGAILAFIKDFFKDTDIFKYYEYNIEIKHINTNKLSSKSIIDSYKEKSECSSSRVEKFKVRIRSAEYGSEDYECANFKFWLSGTYIVKYEFCNPDYMKQLFRDKWPIEEKVKNNSSDDNIGTVTISDKDQTVNGTSLVIENQANEFMQTMNSKFIRKKGEN